MASTVSGATRADGTHSSIGTKAICVGTVKPAPTSKLTRLAMASAVTHDSVVSSETPEPTGEASASAMTVSAKPPPTTASARRSEAARRLVARV